MIRITAGEFRSRLLKTPFGDVTKPTMDKVRLGVFSAIGEKVNGAHILDLFAGCGSYSFEALSRGASSATLIDNGFEQISIIKDNAHTLGVSVKTLMTDVISFLKECSEKYDIIFVDPPYNNLDVYYNVVNLILEKGILNDNGIIVLESEKSLLLDETKFKKVKMYKYGIAKVYLLRK